MGEEKGVLGFENNKYKNSRRDGVGQLRAYCVKWKEKLDNSTIPILTNGIKWAIFEKRNFTQELTREILKTSYQVFDINYEIQFKYLLNRIR